MWVPGWEVNSCKLPQMSLVLCGAVYQTFTLTYGILKVDVSDLRCVIGSGRRVVDVEVVVLEVVIRLDVVVGVVVVLVVVLVAVLVAVLVVVVFVEVLLVVGR